MKPFYKIVLVFLSMLTLAIGGLAIAMCCIDLLLWIIAPIGCIAVLLAMWEYATNFVMGEEK